MTALRWKRRFGSRGGFPCKWPQILELTERERKWQRSRNCRKWGRGYAGFEALRGPLRRGIQEAAVRVATAQENPRVPGWR